MDFRIITLPVAALLALAIYTWFLQPLNASIGLVPVDIDLSWFVLFVVWMLLTALIIPRRIDRPSDLFLLFYCMICLFWSGALWGSTDLLSINGGIILLILLFTPAISVVFSVNIIKPKVADFVFPVYLFRPGRLYFPLLLLLVMGGVAALTNLGHGGFGIDDVYERRLAGREALSGSTLAAYLIPISINGAAPLLAFMAGWRRSPMLLITVLCFAILMFWFLGLKAPFVNIVALFGVGVAIGLPILRRFLVPVGIYILIVILASVFIQISDGSYSAIADYVLRRIIMVQPEVQTYYVDYFLRLDFRDMLLGADLHGQADWTFLIGETYFHNPDTNADTNGFLHALLRGGLVGYVMSIALVCALLVVVDVLYEDTGMREFIGIAGLYGILVSEQSCTTALLTSGIALCLALIILFSYPSSGKRELST